MKRKRKPKYPRVMCAHIVSPSVKPIINFIFPFILCIWCRCASFSSVPLYSFLLPFNIHQSRFVCGAFPYLSSPYKKHQTVVLLCTRVYMFLCVFGLRLKKSSIFFYPEASHSMKVEFAVAFINIKAIQFTWWYRMEDTLTGVNGFKTLF